MLPVCCNRLENAVKPQLVVSLPVLAKSCNRLENAVKPQQLGGAIFNALRCNRLENAVKPQLCQVKAFSDVDRQEIVKNEAIASYLANIGNEKLKQTIMESSAFEAVKDDIIAQFLATFNNWEDLSEEAVRQWVDAYDDQLETQSQLNEDEDIKRDIIKLVSNGISNAYSSDRMKEYHLECTRDLINSWLAQKAENRKQAGNFTAAIVEAKRKTGVAVEKIIH